MIGRLLRLGVLGSLAALIVDRMLARRAEPGPAPIVNEIRIDAPIDAVWAVVADVARQPDWMDDLVAVRILTPPPVGVGTEAVGTVRMLGITVNDPVTVTDFDPPGRFAIRHEGLFTGSGTITLQVTPDGRATHVRWEEILVAPVLPHLADRITRPVFAAVFAKDLRNLQTLVEA